MFAFNFKHCLLFAETVHNVFHVVLLNYLIGQLLLIDHEQREEVVAALFDLDCANLHILDSFLVLQYPDVRDQLLYHLQVMAFTRARQRQHFGRHIPTEKYIILIEGVGSSLQTDGGGVQAALFVPCYFLDAHLPFDLTVASEFGGDKGILVVFDAVIGAGVAVEPDNHGEVHVDVVGVDGDVDLVLIPQQSVDAIQLLDLGHQLVEVGVPDQILLEQVYLFQLGHLLLLKGALDFPAVATEYAAEQERVKVNDVAPGVEGLA